MCHQKSLMCPVSGCFPKLVCHESVTTGNELPVGFNLVIESEFVPVEESPVTRP